MRMSHVSINESWHTYEGAHIASATRCVPWCALSHVLLVNETCPSRGWVMSHVWRCAHGTCDSLFTKVCIESRPSCEWVMSLTCEWVTSHSRTCISRLKKSRDIPVNRLILIVGLTNSWQSNLYKKCSLMNFNLDWDRSVMDSNVIPRSQAKRQKAIRCHEYLN